MRQLHEAGDVVQRLDSSPHRASEPRGDDAAGGLCTSLIFVFCVVWRKKGSPEAG
jgi:hypothetical protein